MDRATRRQHRERLWKKRRRYYGCEFDLEAGWPASNPKKRVVINTPTLCSTCCSGNYERRYWGKVTRQEELIAVSEEEQLEDLNSVLIGTLGTVTKDI